MIYYYWDGVGWGLEMKMIYYYNFAVKSFLELSINLASWNAYMCAHTHKMNFYFVIGN